MTHAIDLTDIPAVTADEMWQLVELLIDSGLIEALPGQLSDLQLDQLAAHFWDRYEGSGERGLAIIHRFMALIDFLGAKRLQRQVTARKWQIVVASVGIAATMRLNPKWGFNRMKLAAALDAQLQDGEHASPKTPSDDLLLDLFAPARTSRSWTTGQDTAQLWSHAS